jgi:ATP-binding cassette subfamily B protein
MAITEIMKRKAGQRRAVAAVKLLTQPVNDPNSPEGETAYKPLEWPVLKKLLGWMAPYRKQYAFAVFLNIVFTLLEMSGPLFLKHLIDRDIPGHEHYLTKGIVFWTNMVSPSTADRIENLSQPYRSYFNIGVTIALWAMAVLLANLISRFNIEYNRRTGERVIFSIRKAVFAHLQHLSMSFYDRTKFGRILSRGTSDIDALSNPLNNGLNTVVLNTMMMTVATAMLLWSDWRIALAVLWLGPLLYFMNLFYRKRIGAQWRIVREHFTRISTNLAENINGMRVVTAYNRQDENLTQFNQLQDLNTVHNVGAAMINGMYQPLLNIVGYAGQVIIFIFGGYLALRATRQGEEAFTVGTLIALVSYWQWFMNPVLNFGTFHNEMMMSMASAERVFALLEQKPDVTDAPNAIELPPIQGRVTFEHVHFHYVKEKPVLHDIHFEAQPGQTIALVGHTGCGKSTIMNLICRFYVPQAGRILLDGYDLTHVTSESLHRQMGIVSQSNYLFSGTVLDNIRYAAPDATEEQVVAAAKELGSHDLLINLKDGYHTQVGERGASMSLGQRQLICFTRAFLANPRILMLDEATSAVDTHTEMVIQEALERLVADRTTFIVAHRLSTVTRADQVLVLDHGKIIERGTHRELLTLGGKYAELYKQFTREIE